jgi:hypothetical protein
MTNPVLRRLARGYPNKTPSELFFFTKKTPRQIPLCSLCLRAQPIKISLHSLRLCAKNFRKLAGYLDNEIKIVILFLLLR